MLVISIVEGDAVVRHDSRQRNARLGDCVRVWCVCSDIVYYILPPPWYHITRATSSPHNHTTRTNTAYNSTCHTHATRQQQLQLCLLLLCLLLLTLHDRLIRL